MYALSAAPAPPSALGGSPLHFAQLSSPLAPVVENVLENFELATENVPESEYETVENETVESPTFLPENWINQFDHNTTHVNIAAGNETFNLLWTDELVNLKKKIIHLHSLLRLLFMTIV